MLRLLWHPHGNAGGISKGLAPLNCCALPGVPWPLWRALSTSPSALFSTDLTYSAHSSRSDADLFY